MLNNFPYKSEGLSWIPAGPSLEKDCSGSTGGGDRGMPKTHWLANYPNWQITHSVRESVSENKVESKRRHSRLTSGLHAGSHVYMPPFPQVCMHT